MPVVDAVCRAALLIALALAVAAVRAETSATLTSNDLKAGMTTAEVEELSQMMEDLRRLQAAGRSYPEGSIERRAQLAMFEKVKGERDARFGYARGLVGQTITLHGQPPPSAQDVVASVLAARKSGRGDGILHPHWSRSNGALVGSAEPPAGSSGALVTPAQVPGSDDLRGEVESFRSDCCRSQGIPPPDDWDYDRYGSPVCYEYNDVGKGILFGVGLPRCYWARAD